MNIATQQQSVELQLTIQATKPCVVRFVGLDKSRPNTSYFDRDYGVRHLPGQEDILVQGTKVFSFPMPLSPEILSLEIKNDISTSNIKVIKAELKPLRQAHNMLHLSEDDVHFIKFVFEFAQKCGSLSSGEDVLYGTSDHKFIIKYLSAIINRETGKKINTPARIHHGTGIIEASAERLRGFTVYIRIVILLHEYFHVKLNVRDERTPDLNAIRYFMLMGFPATEAMYAFTKVLGNGQESREKENIAYIRQLDKQLNG